MHLNWLAKIKVRASRPVVVSIIVNYCCTRKIREETETEETINFFVRFLSFVALQFGVPGSLQSTPMMLIHRSMDLDYWWPYLVSNIKMVREVIVLLARHYPKFLILNMLLVSVMIREIPTRKNFIAALSLLTQILLEIGFTDEIRTTSKNKEVPQTFFHNSSHSQKKKRFNPFDSVSYRQPCISQFCNFKRGIILHKFSQTFVYRLL